MKRSLLENACADICRKLQQRRLEQFRARLGRERVSNSGQGRNAVAESRHFLSGVRLFPHLVLLPVSVSILYIPTLTQLPLQTVVLILGGVAYTGLLLQLAWRRSCKASRKRAIDYHVPLSLEALAMLMRSGLSLVPAMGELAKILPRSNPLAKVFERVFVHTMAGREFSEALLLASEEFKEPVIVHTLTCLRNNALHGGEMLPALEQLVEYTHRQWLARVDVRVRRLEAQVVIPVFAAVLGLACLIFAVPAVPVAKLLESLEDTQTLSGRNMPVTLSGRRKNVLR